MLVFPPLIFYNMNKNFLLLVMILQTFIRIQGETNLVSTVIEHLMECVAQAPEKFSIETCQEMILPKNDNNQSKYDDCKCMAACTAKKLGLIDDNDNGVPEKLKYYAETIDADSMWKKEADVVIEKCSNVPGKGCELAFNWLTCAMGNSENSLKFARAFLGGDTEMAKNK